MNPQDDPEARIRALEQPLADTARATELGTTPFNPAPGGAYPPPPVPPMPPPAQGPYPQPGYGTPWAPPPAGRRPSAGVPWIVIGIAAVVFMAIAGGIGFYLSTRPKHQYGSFTVPSISVPSIAMPSIPSMSSEEPSQPSLSAGPPAPTTPPAGGSLSVAGISENKTIVCNDSRVSISGVSNTVTITGHCTSVDVSGMQNHVTLDTSDSIVASGFNNVITYHTGNPNVDNSGGSNDVHQG
jgi:hypothetical protein